MHVLNQGTKDNTYKFAFARFLLEYSQIKTETHVEFSTIAEYYLKYYWPQVCNSKLRQSPRKSPEVIQIIENEFDKPYYPQTFDKIKQEEPVKIENCIRNIERKCFEHVTYAFQNVKIGDETVDKAPIFFEWKKRGSKKRYDREKDTPLIDRDYGINLNLDAMSFFKRRSVSLNKAVTLEWARFLEEINVGAPKLIAKIEGKIPSRDLTTERDELEPFEKNCFYCKTLLETAEINVEHVIPFSYIMENEMWNLTLVCKQCNCKKLGSLPSPKEKWLGKLFERNKKYRDKIVSKSDVKVLDKSLKRLGDKHESIIEIRYDNAEDLGFLLISMD